MEDLSFYANNPSRPPFQEWLQTNSPRLTTQEVGEDRWIRVFGPYHTKTSSDNDALDSGEDPDHEQDQEPDQEDDKEDLEEDENEKDLPGLRESWKSLCDSGQAINFHKITALARQHYATAGKWMVFNNEAYKAELAWNKIATAIVEGRIPSSGAKVSAYDGTGKHVICTYNENYTDELQVYELERAMRKIGIRTRLSYKPDVYTYLGIYIKNEWGVRPTIYASNYYAVDGSSKITRLFEET